VSLWWYITRSTGLIAGALIVASVMFGLTFSARNVPGRATPAWWVDLHRWLGGLALGFTAVHLAATVLDPDSGLGWGAALLPERASALTRAITWGVVSFWLLVVVVFTTWPKRRLRLKAWRMLHLLSIPATYLMALHTIEVGTDAKGAPLLAFAASCVPMVVYPLALRLLTPVLGRVRETRPRHIPEISS
jgi:DMSO/TMAO reductase YedYZ heme-binding membrane subunit